MVIAADSMIVFVESSTTGVGLSFVAAALEGGMDFVFVCRAIEVYTADAQVSREQKALLFDRWIPADTSDPDSVAGAAERVRERGRPAGLVALTDRHIEYAAALAERLGAPFLPGDVVRLCRNKEAFRGWHEKRYGDGFFWRSFADLDALDAEVEVFPYPVVLKNSRGSGSIQVAICFNADDVRDRAREFRDQGLHLAGQYLVERYVPGPLYSAEVVITGGKATILGVTDRELGPLPHFCEIAASFPVPLDPAASARIRALLDDLIEEFSIVVGQLHIEFVALAGEVTIVEVNPRLAGSLVLDLIGAAYGVDPYRALLPVFSGHPPDLPAHPVRGCALRAIVSDAEGSMFRGLENLALISGLPGVDRVLLHKRPGDRISGLKDWSAAIATLVGRGDTAYAAAQALRSISSLVKVDHDASAGRGPRSVRIT